MRHPLLIAIAMVAVLTGCGGQRATTATPPTASTMNTTLDICGLKKIPNPTETDIRQAVSTLDTGKNDAFLILGPTEMTYIQIAGDEKAGFHVEYQENDVEHHYRAKRDLTVDEVVKTLLAYSAGSDEWKRMTEWEHLTW